MKKKISITTEEKERKLTEYETIVKSGGKGYYVYSAVGVGKNEL